MIPVRIRSLLIVAGFLSALSAGCLSKEATQPTAPVDPYPPQDSPAHCLAILDSTYVHRDNARYAQLFAGDFTFVFSPMDAANPTNPTPTAWGAADEDSSARHMFKSEWVDKIALSFTQTPGVESTDTLTTGTWKVNLTDVQLYVYTRQDGTPWIYHVAGGTGTFYLREYPDEHASNGRPLWRIWLWKDQPISLGMTPSALSMVHVITWGEIKSVYR